MITTIPEDEQHVIIAMVQRLLVETGIPTLMVMAVDGDDLIERVENYQRTALTKHGNPYGNRTSEQIADFIFGEIAYDHGQSDAGM